VIYLRECGWHDESEIRKRRCGATGKTWINGCAAIIRCGESMSIRTMTYWLVQLVKNSRSMPDEIQLLQQAKH